MGLILTLSNVCFEDFNLNASSIAQKTCLAILILHLRLELLVDLNPHLVEKAFTNQKYSKDLNITNNFYFFKIQNKIGKMSEFDFS